jgi:hypothetical protein
MPVANLVLQYVRTLIWPSVVIVAVLVFKSEVRGLFARLTSVAGAGISLGFEADARQALESAQSAVEQQPAEQGTEAPRPAAPEEAAAFDVLRDVALSVPEAAILGAWRLVEMRVSDLAQLASASERPKQRRSPISDMRLLRNLLPSGFVEVIDSLRKLRNRVAHEEQASPLSAIDYVSTARLVVNELDAYIENFESPELESPE